MARFRKLLCALLSVLLLLPLVSCEEEKPEEVTVENPTLRVYTLNVGKADCIILQTKSHLIVLDTGEESTAETLTDALKTLGKKVDLLILSHYDKDHIGGVKKLLKKASVETVFLPAYNKGENTEEVWDLLDKYNLFPRVISEKTEVSYDGVMFELLPTALELSEDEDHSNLSSLALLVTDGENRLLFAGDAVGDRLTELVSQVENPAGITYLKVPHHGVYDENSESFLEALSPEFAVITCSGTERPDAAVVRTLEESGCQVFLTLSGTVIAESNGKNFTVRYAE